jgi:hypothetical protein
MSAQRGNGQLTLISSNPTMIDGWWFASKRHHAFGHAHWPHETVKEISYPHDV